MYLNAFCVPGPDHAQKCEKFCGIFVRARCRATNFGWKAIIAGATRGRPILAIGPIGALHASM